MFLLLLIFLVIHFFQKMIGNPIEAVQIPAKINTVVTYSAAMLTNAPHPQAAKDFLKFLKTKRSSEIYRKFGFMPLR